MSSTTLSAAEQNATKAQELPSFSNFNLLGARERVAELLRTIGQNGIFHQYTRHDMSHIETLLSMLDWIVIPQTADQMTAVDWMLTVLAIYLHDAGLVVTQSEFDQRESVQLFRDFKISVLDATEPSTYQERIEALAGEELEKFLYQEFVRTYHPKRIRSWITGESSIRYGVATEAKEVTQQIVSSLDKAFCDDLAKVCESHHENDLEDRDKYPLSKPYGSARGEVANIQFASILLRTVDLLHVTRDRAPSVAFRLSTPSDPKSIEEWHKQMSVVSVRESKPRDDSGAVIESETPDTVAVSATFYDPKGFFSLTEYLLYVESQLKQSHQWATDACTKERFRYLFPWKRIDTSQIKAVNFESKQFSFELDKPKILKLLTGHTLYSDSNVVIRELVQNSLDATRLQFDGSKNEGEIALRYDTQSRLLTIDDNGTGMTQEIIEEHFLNVGSSRYNDESFRKQYPHFSAISRFGIGILSTFMLSDEIEVLTKSPSEEKARNISIRSLNGRYLIRLLEPESQDVPKLIREHGTRIQMKLRVGTKPPDLHQTAGFWILFPECKVTVQVDGGPVLKIGHRSPRVALEETLTSAGLALLKDDRPENTTSYKVIEHRKGGLSLAFAVEWNPVYKVWNFVNADKLNVSSHQSQNLNIPIGMCVQGVRVENSSPGFTGRSIISVSNIAGPGAPATNFARSTFETGDSVDNMLSDIYDAYAEHIKSEIFDLEQKRGASASAAASEGRFMLSPLQWGQENNLSKRATKLFRNSLTVIPWLTIDKENIREVCNIRDLESLTGFWTIESSTYRSAEDFIRRMPSGVSFAKLAGLGEGNVSVPENLLSGYAESYRVRDLLFERFDVDQVSIDHSQRRVDFHWTTKTDLELWKSLMPRKGIERNRLNQLTQVIGQTGRGARFSAIVLQNSDSVKISGVDGECGVRGTAKTYIFKENDLHSLAAQYLKEVEAGRRDITQYLFLIGAINMWMDEGVFVSEAIRQRNLEAFRQNLSQQAGMQITISDEINSVLLNANLKLFNPMKGERFGVGYGFDLIGNVD